jgi:hypothetical protein
VTCKVDCGLLVLVSVTAVDISAIASSHADVADPWCS